MNAIFLGVISFVDTSTDLELFFDAFDRLNEIEFFFLFVFCGVLHFPFQLVNGVLTQTHFTLIYVNKTKSDNSDYMTIRDHVCPNGPRT